MVCSLATTLKSHSGLHVFKCGASKGVDTASILFSLLGCEFLFTGVLCATVQSHHTYVWKEARFKLRTVI